MVFSTHSIVGGSLAVISGANPIGAFIAGVASHYLLDSVPHWDYELLSKKEGQTKLDGDLEINKKFLADLCKMAIDLAIGFGTVIFLFHPLGLGAILDPLYLLSNAFIWGAIGGILPDALQFLYYKIRKEPLVSMQKFHIFVHTEIRMKGRFVIGPLLQFFIALIFILLAI